MMKRWATKLAAGALVATAALGAGTAEAGTFNRFGVGLQNLSTTRTAGTFDVSFSGTLTVSMDADSTFDEIILDDVGGFSTNGFVLSAFSSTLEFTAGAITSGYISLSVTNGSRTDSIDADLRFSPNAISGSPGSWSITGLLMNGEFSSTDSGFGTTDFTFAGWDIKDFWLRQGIGGALFGDLFKFRYNGSPSDDNTGAELTLVIPAPPAVLWGLAGLAGLAIGRKRLRSLGLSKR